MPKEPPTLHLLCGKAAAGKSTLAQRLATAPRTILLSEDDWLTRRNAAGTHPYQVSDAEFDEITAYFVLPTPAEGFNIVAEVG